MLNEKNYIREINSYSKEKWMPLFKLIPIIEETMSFGERSDLKNDGNVCFTQPVCSYHEIVSKFHHMVYAMPIMINFQWMK